MDNQNFVENSFIIDLSNAKDTLQVINELSNILEMSESKNKNICLKLREVELSQSQLLSIKALIQSTGSTLAFIDTDTERTISSANELGILISKINSNLEIEEVHEVKSESESLEVLSKEEKNEKEKVDLQDEQQEQASESQNLQIPVFMNVEEEKKEELHSEVGELFPKIGFDENEIKQNSESELSYEIFKTEELEEEKNEELPTFYLKQTLRSGQTLSYDGNILVIGDTHPGSEIIAKGDITVWGVLGGIAHAGTSGDKNARIRALKLNGIQLRIAGIYAGRTNTENIPFIQRSNEFTPQEARIENDTIVVRSINNEI